MIRRIHLLIPLLLLASVAHADEQPRVEPRTSDQWVELLRDGDVAERKAAVEELAGTPPELRPSVPALMTLFDDDDRAVRQAAGAALAAIGEPAVADLIEGVGSQTELRVVHSCLTLRAIGPAAAPAVLPLASRLDDPSVLIRRSVLHGLRGIGPGAAGVIPGVARRLTDDDASVRKLAVRALARIEPEPAERASHLTQALSLSDAATSAEAAKELARIGPAARVAVPRLADLVESQRGSLYALLNALKAIDPDHPRAVQACLSVIDDAERKRSHAQAAKTLGACTSPAAVRAILERMPDEITSHMSHIPAARAWQGLGPAAVPALIGALTHSSVPVRRAATFRLATVGAGEPAARDALLGRLRDTDWGVVVFAVSGLGESGDASCVGALLDRLGDANAYITVAAIRALCRLAPDDPQVLDALRSLESDPNPRVRNRVRHELARIARRRAADQADDTK